MKFISSVFLLLMSTAASAAPATPFQFASVQSTDEMRKAIETDFPLGTARAALRQRFVAEGGATPKAHPVQADTEKYIYDINLCRYYVWRWNISADFDTGGLLLQAYVNGDPVFASGPQKKDPKSMGKADAKAKVFKVVRPRPEASKGEKELVYILLDADGDDKTISDQILMGGGPTRADPLNMGKMHVYANVEPWRSIFDADVANGIAEYAGDCSKADQLYEQQKAAGKSRGK
jgi:hypothetical protein